MELLFKYLTQNVLYMQKIGYICLLASTVLLRWSMGIVQVKVRWLILTCGAGSSRPVLNQNPLGSLHYRGLFHVH